MAHIRTLIAIGLGLAMAGAGEARFDPLRVSTPQTNVPPARGAAPAVAASDAATAHTGMMQAAQSELPVVHGDDVDDQPAGACWVVRMNGGPASCVCSVDSVEDLFTPQFMRGLLADWRDAGRLSVHEWRARVQEIDAACAEIAP